jgi:hypothetical protein
MRLKFIIFLFITLCFSNVYGQVGGSGIFGVMKTSLHSRSMAMGGYLLAHPQSDIQYTIDNPGLLNHKLHNQYGATYGNLLPGVKSGGAGYARNYRDMNFSLHAQYIDYGDMRSFDAGGNELGTVTANEIKFTLGYSQEISKRLTLGVQAGFVYSVLGPYVSTGVFSSLGLHYNRADTSFQVGFVVKNMGYQTIVYKQGEQEPMPFEVQLGASYKPIHMPFRFQAVLHSLQRWDLTYDQYITSGQVDLSGNTVNKEEANFIQKGLRHLVVGGELVLGKHLGVMFGYNHQRRMEMAPEARPGVAGFGFGVRIKVWKYHLTYGSASIFPGMNTNMFSLSLIPSFYK